MGLTAFDGQAFGAVHHGPVQCVSHPDPDLESAGVGGFVPEQDEVEGSIGGFEFTDDRDDAGRSSLWVPFFCDRGEHTSVDADAGGIPELFLGGGRTEREYGRLAPVFFDELCGRFDGALLVRAGRERQVGGVDGLAVGGDVDVSTGRRHALHADEHSHRGSDFMRSSVGSNNGWLPTLATRTGYCSFM